MDPWSFLRGYYIVEPKGTAWKYFKNRYFDCYYFPLKVINLPERNLRIEGDIEGKERGGVWCGSGSATYTADWNQRFWTGYENRMADFFLFFNDTMGLFKPNMSMRELDFHPQTKYGLLGHLDTNAVSSVSIAQQWQLLAQQCLISAHFQWGIISIIQSRLHVNGDHGRNWAFLIFVTFYWPLSTGKVKFLLIAAGGVNL